MKNLKYKIKTNKKFINFKEAISPLISIFKFHMHHPIFTLMVDFILIVFIMSMFGSSASLMTLMNFMLGLASNKIIVAILAFVVLIFIVPFMFISGETRTKDEIRQDRRISDIMKGYHRY